MISDAVSISLLSRIYGYKIKKGDFATVSPNLQQRIVILAEANTANQLTLDTSPKEFTSALKAGQAYGFGSPIYAAMRILIPKFGGGVAGIPVIVIAQAEAPGATSKIIEITPTGVANAGGVHKLKIAGRDNIDGFAYDLSIAEGDTVLDINQKIADAVNNVLACPMTATEDGYTTALESKWRGATAEKLTVEIDTGDDDLGITYTINSTQTAIGTPSIATALESIGNEWHTLLLNSYGTVSSIMSALEGFNGVPGETPSGRYTAIIFKPLVAVTGSTDEDPSAITDARENQCTIAIAPAPLSPGLPLEAAANMIALEAPCAQNTPHLDVLGRAYPDMPVPTDKVIGAMSDYLTRDAILKKGCSTVDMVGGVYIVQDFVTTYHPEGEEPAQFRYVRNLIVDWNIRFSYYLKEQKNVADHTIVADDDTVNAEKTIKPKQWKKIVRDLAEELGERALVADVPFMKDSIQVQISESNPDRLETFFKAKRTGTARILSTTAEMGFNFGQV